MSNKKGMTDKEIELMLEMRQLAREANKRISKIEKEFGRGSWATRNLENRLGVEKAQALTKSGKISMSSNMTIPQMRSVISASKMFLNSKTSTIQGIQETREKVKNSMSISADISYSEAEIIQRIWEDKNISKITHHLKGSDFINFISDAVENDRMYKVDTMEYLQKTVEKIENEDDETYKRRLQEMLEENRKKYLLSQLERYVHGAQSDEELKEEAKRIIEKYFR